MTDAPDRYEAIIGRLAADPGFGMIAAPGAGVLVWDRAVENLLWASPAAEDVRDALTDETGRLLPGFRAHNRLRALSAGLASQEGARLERLPLDPARPWLPLSCACRLASLENGETVLVTVFVGPVPRTAARRPAPQETTGPAVPDTPATSDDAVVRQEMPRGTIRFVWQTDAETRFTEVSPGLAQAVGPKAADIVGRTWEEVARTVAEDPDGTIAALYARRETWGACPIAWSIDNSPLQVPVDWAGMPVFRAGRELIGFRGFGLLRLDALRDRAVPDMALDGKPANIPADEMPPEVLSEAFQASEPSHADDPWFSQLRDQVADALSGGKPPAEQATGSPGEERAKARPAGSSGLSNAERSAFREIARALSARAEGASPPPDVEAPPEVSPVNAGDGEALLLPTGPVDNGRMLDQLPVGVLIHRDGDMLFANRSLLDLVGYESLDQVRAEGGIGRLFGGVPLPVGTEEDGPPLALVNRHNEGVAVHAHLSKAEWAGEPAHLIVLNRVSDAAFAGQRSRDNRIHELEAILDTATDGVIVLDETGRILTLNRSAEALFGYDEREVVGSAITVLLEPESHMMALDYLEGLRSSGVASLLNDGREVLGRVRQGGAIPLFMTMGRVSEGPERKFCAVLRDITAFKKAEGELVDAKRAAEEASAQKSDLLAKISHEIRTPLNAILGFAEVMLEERFGPVGNERYRDYLKDVHASGSHVISLVNDLLDLAKVEAGRLELSFSGVNLNELVSACVTLLQPQAARERIVMRTSFAEKLPPVMADERSVRQIVLNLVSNAIKFTDAGGQIIISTTLTDRREVTFRVRDTGIGMTPEEVEAALEPFRQLATTRKRGGTGLGLPLTKALVEANRGALQIASHPNEGTLVEVIFPPARVLAQ